VLTVERRAVDHGGMSKNESENSTISLSKSEATRQGINKYKIESIKTIMALKLLF
jgi:hypothetical protein